LNRGQEGRLASAEAIPGPTRPSGYEQVASEIRRAITDGDEGLLEFRRGRGISVAGTPERGAVVQRAKELVEFARHHGYRVHEVVTIIEDVG
jgi:hypothetical protein